jgi:membrane-associated phospholipid phosphatase
MFLAMLFAPASSARAGDDPSRPCLWDNVAGEGADLVSSPVNGTWEGYALAAGFGGLLAVALHNDLPWYGAVQDGRNAWQDKVMPVVTLGGDGLFHLGAYAALYGFGDAHDKEVAAQAVEGQVLVAVLATTLKAVFTASRPTPEDHPDPRTWFTGDFGDASFPSGHAMTAFCAAAILGRGYQAEWLTYPLAALVAYSRVYTQRHFPSDVVAGAGLGLLIGQTVVAYHAARGPEGPGVRFTVEPQADGGKLVVSWAY